MKLQRTKLGFTLIELLVVITIIGILATGAVSTYTSQIQKARDSTRLTDIMAVKSGIEQFYQDAGEYPYSQNTGVHPFSGVSIYTPKMPSDPKSGQSTANSSFDYIYTVGEDVNTITGQDFEISTTFENQGNIDNKAVGDGGSDTFRLEVGMDLSSNNTNVSGDIATTIAGLTCVNVTGGVATCNTEAVRLLIRNL